ncbi:Rv3235 family protein [Actinocorallia sp. A-T 12471]|uniref:Rv3235 family protein n=1 Tax=Actinocorallia sp. A-T 12471 TaxID=3089813 RepID=UPI0029CE45B8|nr:Rv3235 family protein [Actinocorallia sp. A-T 12471]MDX6744573.1 Rv3235 family protein [Actinocorallia sp. A-T 12471]
MGRVRVLRLVPPPIEDEDGGDEPRTEGNLALAPDADGLEEAAERVIWIAAEVFAGLRPFPQLARLSTVELAEVLSRQRHPAGRVLATAPRIRNRRVQRPRPGVAEVTATVIVAGRIQPVAVRLVRRRGVWRCAAVETALNW